jgi:hypothetical protein
MNDTAMPPTHNNADATLPGGTTLPAGLAPADRHPTEDEWVRFAASELDPEARAGMADHIVACAECARTYRAVAEVTRGAARLPAAGRPERSSTWRQSMALAASVALAITGWSWLIPVPAPETRSDVPAAAPSIAAAPAPVAAVPAPTVTPVWAALGPAPAVQLPASFTLAVRGPQDDASAFMRAFGAAIAPYRAGQFAAAAEALTVVATAHPDVPEAAFYLGIARLHAGQPGEAVDPLRRGAASAVVGSEARWWEAVALARDGRSADAQQALERLCASDGAVARRACTAVATSRE